MLHLTIKDGEGEYPIFLYARTNASIAEKMLVAQTK